ncbi:MAG: hypothetical protein ACFE9R_07040 [Candidatus Hermodarchaeota archaeon]
MAIFKHACKRNIRNLSLVCISLIGLLIIGGFIPAIAIQSDLPRTSDVFQTLIDKVYTFEAPYDSLLLDNLYFHEEYCYYTTLEVVTPHNCAINITVIDPDEFAYRIFETEMDISQEDGWFEIPFGAATSGNYSIFVEVLSSLTLNIHLELQKEHKCLYDIIPLTLQESLKFYEVSRYTDGMEELHNILLRTDYSYKFYIARVSSIGGLESSREVEIFYNLSDPEDILFQLYFNETLVSIGDVLTFDFGTAIGGLYTLELLIHCKVECVNIAYAIVEDYKLSDQINGTNPPPNPTNNGTTPRGLVILPSYFTFIFAIGCGVLVLGAIIYVIRKRKRNIIHNFNI